MNYCTYFNSDFIIYGLSLCKSLQKHSPKSSIFVLALDVVVEKVLAHLMPDINVVTLKKLEGNYTDLLTIKHSRSQIEYYWTCTPHILDYLISVRKLSNITYLDSDQLFFKSPKSIEEEIKKFSISILPHRFKKELEHLNIFGEFNVSWISVLNDENAIKALGWWRFKCLEDCSINFEKEIVGDQKYLDFFHKKFYSVHTIMNQGCGVAPWNSGCNYNVILYHFQSLRHINNYFFCYDHSEYKYKMSKFTLKNIYKPYLLELVRFNKKINKSFSFKQTKKSQLKFSLDMLTTYEFIFLLNPIIFRFNLKMLLRFFSKIYTKIKMA